jgi:glucose/mannose-6-phosphate isomerase
MVDERLKKIDSQNMYQNILSFPAQIRLGINIGMTTNLRGLETAKFGNIILAGMGGSAIGGDLVKSFISRELDIPFEIHRSYGLPSYVDSRSLVICSSYSGLTEETLTAFKLAQGKKCHLFCITTGGELAQAARNAGVPAAIIPTGLPPRAALGYSFTSLLLVLGHLGLCIDYSEDLEKTADFLDEQEQLYQFESTDNRAFELANELHGKIVIIYAGADLFNTVALRFKGQICENAKQLAFCNVFPEFNHNELVGWELSGQFADNLSVVIFRDKDDHPQITKRMDIISEILIGKKIKVINLESFGQSSLSRMLSAVQLGDFISYYMALLNGVDPTPIEVINYLKQKLSGK